MIRLLVHVEGQTEETFVNEMLAPHLYAHGYGSVSARLLGNARLRSHRGGIKGWIPVRADIARHLLQDSGSVSTMMVDYYALPESGEKQWPGRAAANTLPFAKKSITVEKSLSQDLTDSVGAHLVKRFVPFVLMHEFEALLFSDCHAFATGIGRPDLVNKLQDIRQQFGSPEEINDSPATAPSKRIATIIEGYQKPLYGNIGALSVGLVAMRKECPGFDAWLTALEAIP